ncbi:unnamed protein product [Clonostachys rosea]|uniref:Fungal-type protein kinase domain-containing protein n=1 Tax=Bionectria ochroleuca TaxID=29856 RepID=A0ABY6UAE5_BIOOC|nr:unnamed protein product [Clonostachys rosea]
MSQQGHHQHYPPWLPQDPILYRLYCYMYNMSDAEWAASAFWQAYLQQLVPMSTRSVAICEHPPDEGRSKVDMVVIGPRDSAPHRIRLNAIMEFKHKSFSREGLKSQTNGYGKQVFEKHRHIEKLPSLSVRGPKFWVGYQSRRNQNLRSFFRDFDDWVDLADLRAIRCLENFIGAAINPGHVEDYRYYGPHNISQAPQIQNPPEEQQPFGFYENYTTTTGYHVAEASTSGQAQSMVEGAGEETAQSINEGDAEEMAQSINESAAEGTFEHDVPEDEVMGNTEIEQVTESEEDEREDTKKGKGKEKARDTTQGGGKVRFVEIKKKGHIMHKDEYYFIDKHKKTILTKAKEWERIEHHRYRYKKDHRYMAKTLPWG